MPYHFESKAALVAGVLRQWLEGAPELAKSVALIHFF
jgi:hypothetical protein